MTTGTAKTAGIMKLAHFLMNKTEPDDVHSQFALKKLEEQLVFSKFSANRILHFEHSVFIVYISARFPSRLSDAGFCPILVS